MGKGSKDKLEKMELRQTYQNYWHTDLLDTVAADPLYCCFSYWCGPCASYLLRRRSLYNDMSRYECCAGYMPCSGKCGEKKCPELCLCTEVCLCFGNSVASTRFLLQDDFNIRTTKCDNCIIGFMFCVNQIACIFSIIALIVGSDEINEASQLLNCLADSVYFTVCTCMQTQHKIELDKRDGLIRSDAMAVPPVQQMSRVEQPYPPSAGYPHQSPPQQPPPPAPYGYPPPPQQPYDHQSPSQQQQQQQPTPHSNYPPQGYPGYPPQGYPSQGYPPYGAYPPPGYPPQAYPHPDHPNAYDLHDIAENAKTVEMI